MRKITSLVAALLLSVATFAQAPQGFSYQAVVRDAQNAIVANQTIDVTLTITAEVGGVAAQSYTETHSVTTNANGLFTLVVGQGASSQKLSDIKWNVPGAVYNLRTETAYGTATTQLMSVPFALYAEQAGELDYQKLAKTLTSDDVQAVLGYVKAAELEEYVKATVADSVYARKSDIPATLDLTNYAKKSDVSYTINYVNDSLDYYYAKKSDIPAATDLSGYAKTADVASAYVTKESFENYVLSGGNADSVDLTVYAKTADVEATYAKKSDIPAAANLDNYVTKDSLNSFVEHQSLADYAKTADVASAYVTKESFENYVLSGGNADSVDLTVYAKTADVEATYAKKSDIPAAANLDNYVTKDSLNNFVKHQSLAGYAKTAEVDSIYAKKSDIPAAANMSGYVKADTLSQYALNTSLADYAKTTDVASAYVTKESFENYVLSGGQADSVDLTVYAKTADVEATYAKKSDIPAAVDFNKFATKRYLADSTNFLTEHQSLAGYAKTAEVDSIYAKKSDIPAAANMSGYVKADTLSQYALNTSLADYAKTADVASTYVTKEAFDNYVLSGQADSVDLTVYAKTADVEATYAKKSELADYATTADVNAESAFQYHYNDSVYLRKNKADAVYAKRADVASTIGYVNDSLGYYYAKKADLGNYATFSYVDDTLRYFRNAFAQKSALYAKADTSALPKAVSELDNDVEYVTASELEAQGYLTEHQSLAAYATKAQLSDTLAAYVMITDLPTAVSELDNDIEYVTTSELEAQGYLTEHQSLAAYTKKDTLANFATKAKLNDTLAAYTKMTDLADVATTGSYNDLTDKPDLATKAELEALQKNVKTANSLFANEVGLADNSLVDLGLSSGNLWATCNVGASSPEQDGDYYAWGETEITSCSYSTYKFGEGWNYTKYCSDAAHGQDGFTDGLTALEAVDDAATVNIGNGWCTPTIGEWEELYNQCYWEWCDDYNNTGKIGYVIYKSADKTLDKQLTKGSDHSYSITTDKHIFLPATGYKRNNTVYNAATFNMAYYWSATLRLGNSAESDGKPYGLRIHYSGEEDPFIAIDCNPSSYNTSSMERHGGASVRPIRHADATVLPKKTSQLTADKIGDMPMATVNVTVNYIKNSIYYDYGAEQYTTATVSFLGQRLTSGTTTFRIPAYNPVFLSVALSKYVNGNNYLTYSVKINGELFDNVFCQYQKAKTVSGSSVSAFTTESIYKVGTTIGDGYSRYSNGELDINSSTGKPYMDVSNFLNGDMKNQIVGPFENDVNTIVIDVYYKEVYN